MHFVKSFIYYLCSVQICYFTPRKKKNWTSVRLYYLLHLHSSAARTDQLLWNIFHKFRFKYTYIYIYTYFSLAFHKYWNKVYHQEYGYKQFKHISESVYWKAYLHVSSASFQLRIITCVQSGQRKITCKLTGWLQTVAFQTAISENRRLTSELNPKIH